ncbi:MAG: ECF transporter S component [Clostridia bacterium]|nr:ECF transporter S component [Clostridia bacterium]
MNQKKNSIYPLVFVGMMAAIIYVATVYLRIQVPTPTGPTNLKVANILILLAGMMFGGVYGGLAAGIGSMLFDLTNSEYITSAPFTFIFFFIMAFVCGKIANANGKNGLDTKQNIVASICGAGSYWCLYIGKNIIEMVIAGSAFVPAVIATAPKMITSGINVVTAIVCAVLLAVPMNKALGRAGVFNKMDKK